MRVLVVEDDGQTAAEIRQALRSVNVIGDVASTSSGAYAKLADAPYDVIVLDGVLPEADGVATRRQLRSVAGWTPIIMLTARAGSNDRKRGPNVAADDRLGEQLAINDLLSRLRILARRDSGDRPVLIRVGSLRLDLAAARVWRGEQEIRLSTREFALLEAFMRSPGQVLSRRQLLETAWNIGHEYRSNAIDVYVRYLREKIDRPFGVRSLETVRGLGYRLRRDGGV
jgi:two-component system, OmpR family, response regulator